MKILIEYGESYYEATPEFPEYFKRKGHEVVLFPSGPEKIRALKKEQLHEMVAGCDIISRQDIKINDEILDLAPNLRLVTTFGAGYGGVDVEACGKRGIPVVNGRGGGAPSVAELSVSMMMSLARKLPQYDAELRGARDVPDRHHRTRARYGSHLRGRRELRSASMSRLEAQKRWGRG